MPLYNSYLLLLLWDPSSLGNIPQLKLKDWTKPEGVKGKWAKNRRRGLSILDVSPPGLSGGFEDGGGWGGGGGSRTWCMGGYVVPEACHWWREAILVVLSFLQFFYRSEKLLRCVTERVVGGGGGGGGADVFCWCWAVLFWLGAGFLLLLTISSIYITICLQLHRSMSCESIPCWVWLGCYW